MDRPAVEIGGARYARVGRSEASYYTLAGAVTVERALYREVGRRNAKVVDAVSLRAGVVEDGWLPRTARAMAHEVQKAPSREAEASDRETGRLPYSRSSFNRVAQAVGAPYVPRHIDIEDALIEKYEIPGRRADRAPRSSIGGWSGPASSHRRSARFTYGACSSRELRTSGPTDCPST